MSIQNQHQCNANNHGPNSKDLFFSNYLPMYLAGNYCYRMRVIAPRPPLFVHTKTNGQSSGQRCHHRK